MRFQNLQSVQVQHHLDHRSDVRMRREHLGDVGALLCEGVQRVRLQDDFDHREMVVAILRQMCGTQCPLSHHLNKLVVANRRTPVRIPHVLPPAFGFRVWGFGVLSQSGSAR
eukprot:CAMPEP_0180244684 /NCGR_PEP_ID=MMETSP0987-20121128/34566_1 /TAXON_ID=697907 /ORGANISM="non described non described, Strain CCMP2293" /LENGTH=111 /DNA_ID=CAMNT_0022212237 /DNA_START=119 /DNA_END=450 /DNA_ORIENTATION=+